MSLSIIDTDVCVIGAGILGLAHAHEAQSRGLSVVVLERSERAVGASVRNFGHVFISAMGDGEALDCALVARRRWLELGASAGLEVLESGSVVVARRQDELDVMAGAAADERRGAAVITPAEVGRLVPIPTDGLLGGWHAKLDLRVDPRAAVGRLAALLQDRGHAQVVWGASVHTVQPGRVSSSRGEVRAPLIIVCPGPAYQGLPPELVPDHPGLTRCKLQMLRAGAPQARRYVPALLSGLSLLRYPGFTDQPGVERVRARVAQERPELVAAGVHLIVTQLPDGDLILGDTHEYGDTPSPFGDERLDELVLGEARRLLGVDRLEVRERWHGTYPTAPGNPFLVTAPFDGVRLVEVVAGIGMTTALGLAPRVLDELMSGPGWPIPVGAATPAGPPPIVGGRAGCES